MASNRADTVVYQGESYRRTKEMHKPKRTVAALLASLLTGVFALIVAYLALRLAIIGIGKGGPLGEVEVFLAGGTLPLLTVIAARALWRWLRMRLRRVLGVPVVSSA